MRKNNGLQTVLTMQYKLCPYINYNLHHINIHDSRSIIYMNRRYIIHEITTAMKTTAMKYYHNDHNHHLLLTSLLSPLSKINPE